MTTLDECGTPALEFPSKPISGETLDKVRSISCDWQADKEWLLFVDTCTIAASTDGVVDKNMVRDLLRQTNGELAIKPSRLGPFYSAASASEPSRIHPDRKPFLDVDGWNINDDKTSGNAGKPQTLYRLRKATP